MNPTIPKLGTQPRKILDALLMADGQWISKRRFIHDMGLTQAGARICELGHPSPKPDFAGRSSTGNSPTEFDFKSYRVMQEVRQLTLV